MLQDMHHALEQAKTNIREAQQRQSAYANKKRRDVRYKVGDKVMITTANLKKMDRAPKLLPKWIGPYTITKVISPVAYELALPAKMKVHPVLHVSRMRAYHSDNNQFPNREQVVRPPPDEIDGQEEWVG